LSGVNTANFNSEGSLVVSSSGDRTVRIWDSETGVCVRVLEGHNSGVNSAAFNSEGSLVVSSSLDYTVRIWQSDTGECVRELQGH